MTDEMTLYEARPMVAEGYAVLNITYNGENGDLTDPIPFDMTDGDILRLASEALTSGGIQGIGVITNPDVQGFNVERFRAKDGQPNRVVVRPKTAFGG